MDGVWKIMRSIKKGLEPKEFIEYRVKLSSSQSGGRSVFDDFSDKPVLRDSIAKEQGFLCCYCMRRIEPEGTKMKIEHYKSIDDFPEVAVTYSNLLGACYGGEGKKYNDQHCDTHRGSTPLTIDPLDSGQCERLIRYSGTGEVSSVDEQVNYDVNETLNLNLGWMKTNRSQVAKSVIEGLKKKQSTGVWTRSLLEKEIEKWKTPKNGKLEEYCQVAIYYLSKKLNAL